MDELNSYIKHHTILITFIVTLAFAVLYAGEIYLYKQTVYLNKMVAEGLMQIKEENKKMVPTTTLTPAPSVTDKMMKY